MDIVSYIMKNISNVLAVLSIVLGLLSIVLGLLSIVQSFKYNINSEKMANDMKLIMVQHIKLLNQLKKSVIAQNRNPNVVCLSKDEIHLHKLSGFNKDDIPSIMNNISHLIIKKIFLNKIYDFLKSDDINFYCNFWGRAESDEEVDIAKLYEILLEYNIIMIIDYH